MINYLVYYWGIVCSAGDKYSEEGICTFQEQNSFKDQYALRLVFNMAIIGGNFRKNSNRLESLSRKFNIVLKEVVSFSNQLRIRTFHKDLFLPVAHAEKTFSDTLQNDLLVLLRFLSCFIIKAKKQKTNNSADQSTQVTWFTLEEYCPPTKHNKNPPLFANCFHQLLDNGVYHS